MFTLLKNYTIATVLIFIVLELFYLGYYAIKNNEDTSIQQANPYSIELRDYAEFLAEGTALPRNKYINKLSYPTLRAKSEELRSEYNRRYQIISLVKERKQQFLDKKIISNSLAAKVERNLNKLRQQNKQVKLRYEKILSFAEHLHLETISKQASELLDSRAANLLKESDTLLRQIEQPLNFK